MANRRQFMGNSATIAALLALPAGWSTVLRAQQLLPRRPIPGSDDTLPIIGLGNSNAFRQNDAPASTALLSLLHENGGAYVDCMGSSRFTVANAARSKNIADQLFLGTYFAEEKELTMRDEAQRLLAITGKKKLDLMHSYVEFATDNWPFFQKWKEEGITKYIGIARHSASYYDSMMKMMATGTVDFLQVNYSLLETQAQERVLPMALDKGVAVTINRPFINGAFFAKVKGQKLPAWAAEFDCNSWAQFSLKFILSHPAVTCVLTETAKPKHALDNIGGGFGRLPDEKTRQRMLQYMKTI